MINDATAREIAGLMAIGPTPKSRRTGWLRIGRAVWRSLHERRCRGEGKIDGRENTDAREEWLRICRAIWRKLHNRPRDRIAA